MVPPRGWGGGGGGGEGVWVGPGYNHKVRGGGNWGITGSEINSPLFANTFAGSSLYLVSSGWR